MRAETHTYARNEAMGLPGTGDERLKHVMRVRADRIVALRRQGLTVQDVEERLGLTYRQQRRALQRAGYKFVPGGHYASQP
jgi:hypothetical protein